MNSTMEKMSRMSSGIQGLDTITNGGFFRGGLYLIQGTPGSGKTILANQICFHQIAEGERALYVTLLAEYHARMVQYLSRLSFFDESCLPDKLTYLSAFRVMREEGLAGLLTFVRRELISKKVTLLIVDGLIAAQRVATSDQAFNEFVHELQGIALATGCTVFLVASADPKARATPEHTMADGIVELSDHSAGRATERALEVTKIRGTGYMRGKHTYKINDDGVNVYPRIEALLAQPAWTDREIDVRLGTGIKQLDLMLGGGLPAGSPTMLLGPSGVGKSTFGLHFLSRCSDAEPGLLYGFYESPAGIAAKARHVCKPLVNLLVAGTVEVSWQPPPADSLDAYGDQLLTAVRRRGVQRLFLDGIGALQLAPDADERMRQYVPALMHELRAQGVTTVFSHEVGSMVGPNTGPPFQEFSVLADNLIVLRYVERGARLHRLVSILKVRDSAFDPFVHEFVLTADGVQVMTSSHSAVVILGTDPPHDVVKMSPGAQTE